jgi:quercetin dioxygenase-like cupin family protein
VQRWGGAREHIREGDIVWIPPGVKHWHGADLSGGMSHLALVETSGGENVTWMEKVSDEQYEGR